MRHSPLATTAVLAALLAAGLTGATAGAADPSLHRAFTGGPRVVYGSNAPSGPFDTADPLARGRGEPAVPAPVVRVGFGDGLAPSGGEEVEAGSQRGFHRIGFPSGGYGGSAYGSGYGNGFAPPIPPAGGLAVYSPGAYGPGPRIIRIPRGYGTRPAHRMHGCCGASAGTD